MLNSKRKVLESKLNLFFKTTEKKGVVERLKKVLLLDKKIVERYELLPTFF
jgi:hypothetical protein